MIGVWKLMIFKVPCSPNLNSELSEEFSLQAGWRGSGQKGTEEASACSDWMLQVFGWTPHSLEQARREEALETPQHHWLAGQKDRNSGILYICIIAFTSVGVLPFSEASAGDWFVVFRIDFLLLVCRGLFPCWPRACQVIINVWGTPQTQRNGIVSSGLCVYCAAFSKPKLLFAI